MINLASTSRAEDSGYHAVKDVADIAAEMGSDYRLIGGHMVSLLVAFYGVTDVPNRETADADMGADFSYHFPERRQRARIRALAAAIAG